MFALWSLPHKFFTLLCRFLFLLFKLFHSFAISSLCSLCSFPPPCPNRSTASSSIRLHILTSLSSFRSPCSNWLPPPSSPSHALILPFQNTTVHAPSTQVHFPSNNPRIIPIIASPLPLFLYLTITITLIVQTFPYPLFSPFLNFSFHIFHKLMYLIFFRMSSHASYPSVQIFNIYILSKTTMMRYTRIQEW